MEMARCLGLSQSTIARAEKGGQILTVRMLDDLGAALGCDIVELLESGRVKLRVTCGVVGHDELGKAWKGLSALAPVKFR